MLSLLGAFDYSPGKCTFYLFLQKYGANLPHILCQTIHLVENNMCHFNVSIVALFLVRLEQKQCQNTLNCILYLKARFHASCVHANLVCIFKTK